MRLSSGSLSSLGKSHSSIGREPFGAPIRADFRVMPVLLLLSGAIYIPYINLTQQTRVWSLWCTRPSSWHLVGHPQPPAPHHHSHTTRGLCCLMSLLNLFGRKDTGTPSLCNSTYFSLDWCNLNAHMQLCENIKFICQFSSPKSTSFLAKDNRSKYRTCIQEHARRLSVASEC